ncbi:hypothetical protein FOZ61_006904 [Perkinsus olseni]|uniref:Peptidase A1 domain-containing protein n=1 Tax=Perkinsus olseni TaxID=32597 RepID=A0A7J6LC34_PEROL|nr:hypothetical protein FOZ61_006904 [Perkinsus olseni]
MKGSLTMRSIAYLLVGVTGQDPPFANSLTPPENILEWDDYCKYTNGPVSYCKYELEPMLCQGGDQACGDGPVPSVGVEATTLTLESVQTPQRAVNMRFGVVTDAWYITPGGLVHSRGEGVHSLLGLGFPRRGTDTYLEQLLAAKVINKTGFTLTVCDDGGGELIIGSLKPRSPTETGSLVYLPLTNTLLRSQKWFVSVARVSIHVVGRSLHDIRVKSSVLIDSGSPGVAAPQPFVDKLFSVFTRNWRKTHRGNPDHERNEYGLLIDCDDTEHVPDLSVRFYTGLGRTMLLTIPKRHLVVPEKAPSGHTCLIPARVWPSWVFGMPIFRGRSIRFDADNKAMGFILK